MIGAMKLENLPGMVPCPTLRGAGLTGR